VSDFPNKTDSRVTALTEVKAGLVAYDPSTGEYFVTAAGDQRDVVRGARRRTFSELRSDGMIEPSSLSVPGPVKLTQQGDALAADWLPSQEVD
jgi:hypothetical protein